MRALFAFWFCLSSAYCEIPDKLYQCVRANCMARDWLQLTASGSEFSDPYDVQPLTYKAAFERMDIESRYLRRLLSETKKDDQLVSTVIQNLSRRKHAWDIQPVRIVATMLMLQKFEPESIAKVSQAYEAAIAEYQQISQHELHQKFVNLLKQEEYPCIFFMDGDVTYQQLTILEYLKKLRK